MSDTEIEKGLGLVAEIDLAKWRKVDVSALRNERTKGLGPPYQKIGRQIFYPVDKLKAFYAASTVTPSRPKTLVDGLRKRPPVTA